MMPSFESNRLSLLAEPPDSHYVSNLIAAVYSVMTPSSQFSPATFRVYKIMKRRLISTGSPLEKTAGYSRAVVQGDWCFVSGTTGYDYDTMDMPMMSKRKRETV